MTIKLYGILDRRIQLYGVMANYDPAPPADKSGQAIGLLLALTYAVR